MKAPDIMTREFETVLPTATVKEVVILFRNSHRKGNDGVHAFMVVDEKGKLVGLITMSHILKAIIPFYMEMAHLAEFAWEGLFERMCHKVQDKKVSELMEKRVITIDPDANLIEVLGVMLKNRVRRLPVIRNGEVIGIIYRKNLFFKIVETMLAEGGR